jgi:hypothetical protein
VKRGHARKLIVDTHAVYRRDNTGGPVELPIAGLWCLGEFENRLLIRCEHTRVTLGGTNRLEHPIVACLVCGFGGYVASATSFPPRIFFLLDETLLDWLVEGPAGHAGV